VLYNERRDIYFILAMRFAFIDGWRVCAENVWHIYVYKGASREGKQRSSGGVFVNKQFTFSVALLPT